MMRTLYTVSSGSGVPESSLVGGLVTDPQRYRRPHDFSSKTELDFFGRAFISLTKGSLFVSNFSAQCNERPHKQRAEFQSQRKNKPIFSVGVFRAPGRVFDLCAWDTPRSKREGKKNVGVRASRNTVTEVGVANGDEFKIVSLSSSFCEFLVGGSTPYKASLHKGIPDYA